MAQRADASTILRALCRRHSTTTTTTIRASGSLRRASDCHHPPSFFSPPPPPPQITPRRRYFSCPTLALLFYPTLAFIVQTRGFRRTVSVSYILHFKPRSFVTWGIILPCSTPPFTHSPSRGRDDNQDTSIQTINQPPQHFEEVNHHTHGFRPIFPSFHHHGLQQPGRRRSPFATLPPCSSSTSAIRHPPHSTSCQSIPCLSAHRPALIARLDIIEYLLLFFERPGWRKGGKCNGRCGGIGRTRLDETWCALREPSCSFLVNPLIPALLNCR